MSHFHRIILRIVLCSLAVGAAMCARPARSAQAIVPRLPYPKGQGYMLTQGYHTFTHIKKDDYAMDFSRGGCDIYGSPAVAAVSGTVMYASQEGYNGGYGTEVIIDHGDRLVSRYAHLIAGSITATTIGAKVRRGQEIGRIGNTGLVLGATCDAHPGTHLHFAMDTVNADGTFTAYDPEPISGYRGMTEGNWYVSDNGPDDGIPIVATSAVASVATGWTSVEPAVAVNVLSVPVPSSSLLAVATSSSTSTPFLPNDPVVAVATDTAAVPAATGTLFAQMNDAGESIRSWYGDNWFALGNGYSGTLTALTLEGKSDPNAYPTQIWLQEYADEDYGTQVQQFLLGSMPFTADMATATLSGFSILLKPYRYYRLVTIQGLQNASAILAGTPSTTVGVSMWNQFIYGRGRVVSTIVFFPYLIMEGEFPTSTVLPPPLPAPASVTADFDALGMQVSLSSAPVTDPDWPASPVGYQTNWSTSTALSDDGWTGAGSVPVVQGNTYLFGVRAIAYDGRVSSAAMTTWSFPPGFVPYIVSDRLSYAYQYFMVPATSTLSSIQLFTKDFGTGARGWDGPFCYLRLYDEYGSSSAAMVPPDGSEVSITGYQCSGYPIFSFLPWPTVLYPDHRYRWEFEARTGNPFTAASLRFYGLATGTTGIFFGDPALAEARFVVNGDSGVLFAN